MRLEDPEDDPADHDASADEHEGHDDSDGQDGDEERHAHDLSEPGQADPPTVEADVYSRLSDLGRRVGRRYDLDEEEAKDLSQDVSLRLFHKKGADPAFSNYEKVAAPLGTKTARNLALNHIRDQNRRRPSLEDYETERSWAKGFEGDPLEQLQVREVFEIAGRTLNQMTEKNRQICLLKMGGLKLVEIAAELDMDANAVGHAWSRCWTQLRAALIDYME